MKRKMQCKWTGAAGLLAAFLLLTLLVKTVDVQPIGPEESVVGLAGLNGWVHERVGVHLYWYALTDWIGVAALLTAAGFAGAGLMQLLRRKSLLRVDADLLVLGVFYLCIMLCYAFFEICIVNYRPVILDEGLEASFPSSHTMLVLCIMGAAIVQLRQRCNTKTVRILLQTICTVAIGVTVLGRLISGVHWFTDILAGVLLGTGLICLYDGAVIALHLQQRKRPRAAKPTVS